PHRRRQLVAGRPLARACLAHSRPVGLRAHERRAPDPRRRVDQHAVPLAHVPASRGLVLLTDHFRARGRSKSTPSKEATVIRIALVLALVLVPAALADGGPSPGVDQGSYGLLSANGAVRYATLSGTHSTVLEAIRTSDGHILRWRTLEGGWGIPFVTYNGTTGGLARNGRALVLAESAFVGGLRNRSTFAVVDPKTFGYEIISLKGDFAFDALSPDARRLYLIEHVSAMNYNRYVVRAYDLYRDRLLPGAIADRTQRGWVMNGSPV